MRPTVREFFDNYLDDLDTLFLNLEAYFHKRLLPRTAPDAEARTLIIFNEVQFCPRAREVIKYFVANRRFDYIETGSLISIKKNVKDILIPSEEFTLEVLPMDFEEFLWARGDTMTMPVIRARYETKKPMGAVHQTIMRSFREYLLVGGMPQAVKEFVTTKDYGKTDFVKQQIVALYTADMQEQHEENSRYVTNFFERISGELSEHNKEYILSHADPNARLRDYQGPIRWLEEAMIINIASEVDEPSAAFNLAVTKPSFKCYLMDTGLLVSLAFRNRPYLENDLYKAVLLDRLHVNEGMLLENMAAQCLRANGHRAYFYTETDKKTRRTLLEVDFLIRQQRKVVAVEVKSGKSDSIKSLLKLKEKFGNRVGDGIVLHHGEVERREGVWYLPYYMATVL